MSGGTKVSSSNLTLGLRVVSRARSALLLSWFYSVDSKTETFPGFLSIAEIAVKILISTFKFQNCVVRFLVVFLFAGGRYFSISHQ